MTRVAQLKPIFDYNPWNMLGRLPRLQKTSGRVLRPSVSTHAHSVVARKRHDYDLGRYSPKLRPLAPTLIAKARFFSKVGPK